MMYNRLSNENLSDEQTVDAGNTETSEFALDSSNYGSTSHQDMSVPRFYVPCCGLVFYVMAFFGFFCSMSLRENLSVAIVAMVNQTAVADEDIVLTNITEDQCPRDPELKYADGELNWDRTHQGVVLGAFYCGSTFTQMPGGWMADHFGGRWLFGGCLLLSSVVALLIPAAARTHIVLVIILLILSGLGEGAMLPSIHAMVARWSAPSYRSIVVSVMYVGGAVGMIVGMFGSGVLCDYGFAGGWPSTFYMFGAFGCVWSVAWFLLCYSSPATHPRISTVERKYWETVIGSTNLAAHPPTPWREIFTSAPVWALAVAYFASDWCLSILTLCLPLFMHDVLGFNMTRNGAFSAVPLVAPLILLPFYGFLADWLRSPGRLSTSAVRKMFFVCAATLSGGFLILVGYISCIRALAVAMMSVVAAFSCLRYSSMTVNQLDLAPLHAGKILGLTHTVASIGAFSAPIAVGLLTSNHSTRSEWQRVFYLTVAVDIVAALIFVIFGSGDRQRWADDTNHTELSERHADDRNK